MGSWPTALIPLSYRGLVGLGGVEPSVCDLSDRCTHRYTTSHWYAPWDSNPHSDRVKACGFGIKLEALVVEVFVRCALSYWRTIPYSRFGTHRTNFGMGLCLCVRAITRTSHGSLLHESTPTRPTWLVKRGRLCSRGQTRTGDLWLMRPTRYRLLHPAMCEHSMPGCFLSGSRLAA